MIPMDGMDKTNSLASELRQAIVASEYRPGAALPSERELMRTYGVSRTTVRRSLQLLADEGFLIRKAGSGTYVGKPAIAGTPRSSARPTTGGKLYLLIPTFSNPFYGEVIDAIEKCARQCGMSLIASHSEYAPANEDAQLGAMAVDSSVRGAILVPSTVDHATDGARAFIAAGKPLVYFGRWPSDIGADGIRIDYSAAARLAVSHLINLGHRRIVYVEGTPHLAGYSMLDGYRETLRAHGIGPDPLLERLVDSPSEQAGAEAMTALIDDGADFTAVFARNDVTAVGIMRALRQRGFDSPQQISVVSVNDSLIARSMDPPLTSVNVHSRTLAQIAFRMLHDRISGAYSGPAMQTAIRPSLTVRASTGMTQK